MLVVDNLVSYYANIKILNEISFNLNQGQVLCLLGRNGAGKTTILKSIMGLVDHTNGLILFNDEKLSGVSAHFIPQKGIGYVPQGIRLFSECFQNLKRELTKFLEHYLEVSNICSP